MSYLSVITLAEAKNYLRVDDTLTADDNAISSMIKSALSYLERETNILVFNRSKDYLFQEYEVRVYDYPINSLIGPTDAEVEEKPLYTLYTAQSSDDTTLTLNVGYNNPASVPQELKDAALYIVKMYYYETESEKVNKGELPKWLRDTINKHKRFLF